VISVRDRLSRRVYRFCAHTLVLLIVVTMFQAFPHPAVIDFFQPQPAMAETVSNPKFVSATVMPNGQAGLLYANGDNGVKTAAEIRFFAYTTEHAARPSLQLSTAGAAYPQLATFRGRLVAAYVDTRAAHLGQLTFRASDDSGLSWSPEAYPLGIETFDAWTLAPRVVASHDAQTLYVFTAINGGIPQYRSTVDPTLVSWTTPSAAGDGSMRPASTNSCSDLGDDECDRAHAFSFMETASPGQWVYVAKSVSGYENSGRGTQIGTLGASSAWTAQVDHFGYGNISALGGHSGASTFLDRSGYVYFIRATTFGERLYMKRSTDGGYTWDDEIDAFDAPQPNFLTSAPVGLYVPGYSRGEYVWYAGYGGSENTTRVTPLWTAPQSYTDNGTTRLFGSAGGDLDVWTEFPETFGNSLFGERAAAGGYTTSATDLSLPGRKLGFSFERWYNSGDAVGGSLGPGWTHSFNVKILESPTGDYADIRLGDGAVLRYDKNPDGTYAKPVGRFETLTKNGDGSFTFLTPGQTKFDLRSTTATVQGDVARGRTRFVSCSAYSDPWTPSSCANVVDGNDTTFFLANSSTEGQEATWGVDLSQPTAMTSFRLVAGCSGIFRRYYVESSPDNAVWTVRYDSLVDVTAGDLGTIALSGGPISARYWRVRGNGTVPCGYRLFTVNLTGAITDPVAGKLTRISEPAGNQITLSYAEDKVSAITDTAGRTTRLAYSSGTNIAVGRPYAKSHEPVWWNPDTNNTELTDGDLGAPNNFGHVSWQQHEGVANLPVLITIDLGTSRPIGAARGYWGGDNIWSYAPDSVEIWTSDDNINFTLRASTTTSTVEGGRFRMDIANVNVNARYVRFKAITTRGDVLFFSEMLVFERYFEPVDLGTGVGVRLLKLIDSTGRRVSYGYDSGGRLSTVIDMLGNTAGQDPNLHKWTYGYDGASRHIASVTDPDARVRVTNSYDSTFGRLQWQKDGMNNQTTYAYVPNRVTVTDARLHGTTLDFDPLHRVSSREDVVEDALGIHTYTESYGYDTYGNREFVIDRNGSRTDFTSDDRGNLLTRLDPEILIPPTPRYLTTYEPDAFNNLKKVTDARGFTTENTFDLVTNVLLSTKQQETATPTYALTKWEYTDFANPGLPTRVISPLGNTNPLQPNYTFSQTLVYWPNGLLKERTDADGNKTTFAYDDQGRLTTMVDPDGNAAGGVPSQHTWTTSYDANDRVTAVIDALGHSALSGYDRTGNQTSTTDRDGNVTTSIYDAAARLWKVQQKPDPLWQPSLVYTTTVTRDANGNSIQVTQDKQGASGATTVVTDYGYDALNRMTSFTTHPGSPGPANLTTSYLLDGNGNTTKRTTADSVVTDYGYDAMSRLKTVTATAPPAVSISYEYDELSRRISMIDITGTSTYGYDGLSRLTQAVQPNGTLGYEYDLDSNRTKITYPTVGAVTYVPSPAGRLSSVTDWGSRQSTYTYTPSGLAKTVVVGSVTGGLTTTYTYDNAQRLTSLVNATSSQTISSHTYTLDNEGNRTALDETISGITTAAAQLAPSLQVNTDVTTTLQDHPAIALGADATFLIWDDARSGNSDIYFSTRNALTGAWSTPNVKVNTDTGTRIQQNPAVAVDSSSNAYAVWQDERNGASKPDIFYRKRTAAGTWVSPDVKVSDDAGGGGGAVQRNVRIAGKGDGTQTAVWVDLRSSQNNIYSSTLSSTGTWLTPNPRVTGDTAAAKDFPDVVVAGDGTSYAVWQDSRNGNADIYFSSLPSGGTTWSANLKISDDPGTAAQRSPRIAIDRLGTLTVVFLDDRVTPTQVRAVRRPLGGSWSVSVVVTDSAARPTAPVALAVRDDGSAQTAWSDTRIANTDIWGSRYDAATSAWATSTLLSDDPGTAAQSAPTLAYLGGEMASSWRDDRGGNGNIRARRTPGDHFAYRYDGLNRLTNVLLLNSESFALDGASNVTSRSGVSETYDAANRLTVDGSTTNTWSNADRLAQRGADIFNYDALDRLTDSTVGGISRVYAYNGDGLLKSRTQGTPTQFLWDPSSSPSRLLKQGSDNIVYGLGPLYVVKADASTLTFTRDGGKSVRAEVNSSGAVTASFRYKVYGQIAQFSGSSTPTYLGYAGQLLDATGLYYMRARWYDAVTGRFATHDARAGSEIVPASLNRYAYANANPVMLTDPSGQCAFICGAFIGVFVYGAAKFIEARYAGSSEVFGDATVEEAAVAAVAGGLTQGLSSLKTIGGIALTGAVKYTAKVAVGAAASAATDVVKGRQPDPVHVFIGSVVSGVGATGDVVLDAAKPGLTHVTATAANALLVGANVPLTTFGDALQRQWDDAWNELQRILTP
jgi:RHS repeat-associated protein